MKLDDAIKAFTENQHARIEELAKAYNIKVEKIKDLIGVYIYSLQEITETKPMECHRACQGYGDQSRQAVIEPPYLHHTDTSMQNCHLVKSLNLRNSRLSLSKTRI